MRRHHFLVKIFKQFWYVALFLSCITHINTFGQEAYPSKPIKILVGFAPGSSSDVAARIIGQKISQVLGQSVVVENRPGASSNLAAKALTIAPPDGYTFFFCTVANVINTIAKGSSEVDLSKDLQAIALIGSVPIILVVHPTLGVNQLTEFIQLAKSKPNEIAYASSGNGTALHMAAMLFSTMADVRMVHVPYQGSNTAMTDLLSGRTTVMFGPASTVMPHVKTGKLKAIASTGIQRTSAAPDLATLNELGLKGFDSSVWFGIMSPLGLPINIEAVLINAIQIAITSTDVQSQFKAQGFESTPLMKKEFSNYIRNETDKWAKVIKHADVKLY